MGFGIGSIAKKLSTQTVRRVKKVRRGAGRVAKRGIIYGAKKAGKLVDPKGKVGKKIRAYRAQMRRRPIRRRPRTRSGR